MKRPIYNQYERWVMTTDTINGAFLRLDLSVLHVKREIDKTIIGLLKYLNK